MKTSYNWLQSLSKKKLPSAEKMADLLTMHSFEVEKVEKTENDWVLDIDILPNRAHDAPGHQEIARELAAILKYPLEIADYSKKIKSGPENVSDIVRVEVRDKKLCPRYTARAVLNVKVKPSPQWIGKRLKNCGLKPINNVVDITNYVMLETNQPLHAFDADKLKSSGKIKEIIVRLAKKGEKMVSLDDEKYDLDENILVIADKQIPLAIAGIKGGKDSGIDSKTKNIILEAANFNPQIIRKASQQLKLKTDASWRFERELDPNLTENIDMAAYLLQDIAGGRVAKGKVDIYPNKVRPKKINLEIERVNSLLGIKIPEKEIKGILQRLGLEVKELKDKVQVTIPTRRVDLTIPEDLIEEVGRIYGFEKIPSQLPKAVLVPARRNDDLVYQNKVRDILSNFGFSEVYNYSFISDKEAGLGKFDLVELANPINQEQKYLRPNLLSNLLGNIKQNKKYFDEVRLFEIGKVFNKDKKGVKEEKRLAGIVDLADSSPQPQEFYLLKGLIDSLFDKLRISQVWYNDQVSNPREDFKIFHESRRAEIKIDNQVVGWLGEIKGQMGFNSRVAGFEIDFEKLVKLATEEREYLPPSKYPAVIRDIAILVEPTTKVEEVLNLIETAGGALVQDVDLFDMYEGENIPEGKKNLAFHIIYQADNRTLTDKEVEKIHNKIILVLENERGWEIRK